MNSLHHEVEDPVPADPDSALRRLFEVAVVLAGAMDQGLLERGLTRARAGIIWLLHQRGPLTQRELSEALGVTPRNVTGLVDALQTDGFVSREAHPTDRRATLVTLTQRGGGAGAKMQDEYRELAKRLFDDIAAADLTSFVAILEQVLGRFHERGSDSPDATA